MRLTRHAASLGLAALASPAFAHPGDHSHAESTHFLVEHGVAAGLIALCVIAGAVYVAKRRKG